MPTWKETLADKMDRQLAEEIDVFETQMALRRQGKLDEKLFAETRLRRGCYGQRYDNGHRHDGIRTQQLPYLGDMTKSAVMVVAPDRKPAAARLTLATAASAEAAFPPAITAA